jgi:hypothetical protein
VDGRSFRWKLDGRNRYIGRAPAAVIITIFEDIENPGTMLQCIAVSNQSAEAEEEWGYCDTSITPTDIQKLIRIGLAKGWDPTTGHGIYHPGKVTLTQYTVNNESN